MKKILIFVMFLALYSCQKTNNNKNISVMEDKKSLINQWYGENHFDNSISDQDDDITPDLNTETSPKAPTSSKPASQASTSPSSTQTSELMRRPEDSLIDAFDQALNLEN